MRSPRATTTTTRKVSSATAASSTSARKYQREFVYEESSGMPSSRPSARASP